MLHKSKCITILHLKTCLVKVSDNGSISAGRITRVGVPITWVTGIGMAIACEPCQLLLRHLGKKNNGCATYSKRYDEEKTNYKKLIYLRLFLPYRFFLCRTY